MAADMFHMCSNLGDYLSFIKNYRVSKKRKIVYDGQIVVESSYSSSSCWDELPIELMGMIVEYLDLKDRVCMSMVCKSWESILKRKDIRVPPQIPWLLFPHERNCKSLSFYDMSQGKIHDIKLPKVARGWQCCGSSKGWLVMAKKKQVFLLNPLSGERHQLPPLTTIPSFNHVVYKDPYKKNLFFIEKIELSSEDPSECTVAAIFNCYQVLACCRIKDKSWTTFQQKCDGGVQQLFYKHIVFCNKTLYVTTFESSPQQQQTVLVNKLTAATYTMKLADDDDDQVTLKFLADVFNGESEFSDVKYFDNLGLLVQCHLFTYLIESSNNSGELLMVRKYMDMLFPRKDDDDYVDVDNNPYPHYFKTGRFEVFKLSPDGSGTSFCINRLQSLDDGVLFLTHGGSCFLPTTNTNDHFNGILGGNCIYFADDNNHSGKDCDLNVSRESGVFYLDDGKIQRPFPSIQVPRHSRTCWFIPNSLV